MRKDIMDKFYSAVKRYRIVLIVAAAVVLLLGIGGVSAKYITEKQSEDILRAKNFYFTSNLLKEGGASYVLNSNATAISFTLGNNIDDIRFAEDNINYTVTISGGAMEGASEGTLTGTLITGAVSIDTLTLNNLEKGKTYTVTAIGKAGYEKTLSATFTVSGDEENVYKHLADHGAYYLLTVWTENVSGNTMIITFPDGLVPDNTDPVMAGIVNLAGSEYKGQPFTDSSSFTSTYSSHQYRFFKNSVGTITVDNFPVVLVIGSDQHIAIPATP